MRNVIALLIFTPALALVWGGYTVWKENGPARRRRRTARVAAAGAESHADGLAAHSQAEGRRKL